MMHPHIFSFTALFAIFHVASSYNEHNPRKPNVRRYAELNDPYLTPQALRSVGDYSEYTDYNLGPQQDTTVNELEDPANQDAVVHYKSSVRRSKEQSPGESLHLVDNWPDPSIVLGQLSAVSLDVAGNVVVFHRGDRVWNAQTFLPNDVYNERNLGPIPQNTIVSLDPTTGAVIREWGSNMFYMPHGLTIDLESNIWVTDVALHQVFKFAPDSVSGSTPLLTLGVRFMPGKDDAHFCKPSDVVAMRNGDFFVSDGYCNTRVMKFSRSGELLMQWGRNTFHTGKSAQYPAPYEFNVPHALTMAEDRNLVCVADRENGRIQCFNCHNGTFVMQLHSPKMGTRLFSVAYSSANGGKLFIVNGPDYQVPTAKGFVISLTTNDLEEEFYPDDKPFSNPHDVAVSPDGKQVYVVELNPYKVWKFEQGAVNTSSPAPSTNTDPISKAVALKSTPRNSTASHIEPLKRLREAPNSVVTAVGIIVVVIAVIGIVFAVAVIRMRKRGYNCRANRWEFPKSAVEGFKLGQFLDRHQGFEKVNTEESDDEASNSSAEITLQHPQFA